MQKVIFACIHNAGRSRMAAAFFNHLADRQKAEALSAGTEPGSRIHPEVLAVMQELGIDLSQSKAQKLTEELARTPSCSSPWDVAISALMYRGCAVMTGPYPTRKAGQSKRYAPFAMKFGAGSRPP